MPRFRNHLALKIVVPFALLMVAIGAIGTLAASGELGARSQGSFDNQLREDGAMGLSMVQSADVERHATLRLLSTTPNLTQGWSKPASLQTSLERALILRPNAIVEALDADGHELVGVVGHGSSADTVTRNNDLSGWPGLSYLLTVGANQVDLVLAAPRPAIFSGQPVRGPSGTLLGVLLVGDYLDDRANAVKSLIREDVSFYDIHGHVLASSLAITSDQWINLALDQATRDQVNAANSVELSRTTGGPGIEVLAPWATQTATVGYVGITASSAGLLQNSWELRLIMAVLFLAGVLLTLLIGILLARRITKPVQRLVEATRLVSAGDLDHQAVLTSRDEIGELTDSFNQMTRSLKEKSASLKATMTQLQDTYLMTIEALAAAVEARDPYTHGHTQRVGDYAVILGRALACEEADIAAIKRASVLHDIGKIGIEDHILRKQARLEPDEEIRMQKHPVIGVDMLKGIGFLDPVLPLIRHHHERWDGHGYPDQVREDEIPLGARILAVADALDAMTSDRPYREARTFAYAKAEILKGSGTHFDPEVVTAFIKSQREIEELLSEPPHDEVQHHPEPGDLTGWRLHVVGH